MEAQKRISPSKPLPRAASSSRLLLTPRPFAASSRHLITKVASLYLPPFLFNYRRLQVQQKRNAKDVSQEQLAEAHRRGLPVLMLPILVGLLANDRDRIRGAVSSAVAARAAYATCPTQVAFGLRMLPSR